MTLDPDHLCLSLTVSSTLTVCHLYIIHLLHLLHCLELIDYILNSLEDINLVYQTQALRSNTAKEPLSNTKATQRKNR
jgi:hypothetical protein